jgi:hypothetical protein
MGGVLSAKYSDIWFDYLPTIHCRSTASGILFIWVIHEIPHICHMYFGSSGTSEDGSYGVKDLAFPTESLIFISVASVLRSLDWRRLKLQICSVTISWHTVYAISSFRCNVRCIICKVQRNLVWLLADNTLWWRCKRNIIYLNNSWNSAYLPHLLRIVCGIRRRFVRCKRLHFLVKVRFLYR